jgi:hypothetical protein
LLRKTYQAKAILFPATRKWFARKKLIIIHFDVMKQS